MKLCNSTTKILPPCHNDFVQKSNFPSHPSEYSVMKTVISHVSQKVSKGTGQLHYRGTPPDLAPLAQSLAGRFLCKLEVALFICMF